MTMTTQQQQTALTQQQPEHQWTVHPVLDGCAPRDGGGVHGGGR
jgi:hypothetical protein